MAPPDGLIGGGKLLAYLRTVEARVARATAVRVGFLEGLAPEADGTSIPMLAAMNEYGGRIERVPSEQTIYRRRKANGDFALNGRFDKKRASNFASTHYVGAYVITIPPRPFFRTMIRAKKGDWGASLGKLLVAKQYDAAAALGAMGKEIEGQLVESITNFGSPRNAPSTIRKKGFDKPLIETGVMRNSVASEVE